MVIDLILDRRDGETYDTRDFYFRALQYSPVSDAITSAMDYGTEKDVKRELCQYIIDNEYNPAICDYVNSVEWIDGF